MPRHVMGIIVDALNQDGKPLHGSRILVLGATYKPDVSDIRESPALDIIALLQKRGAVVAYHDPFVPELEFDGVVMQRTELDHTHLEWADCVVIVTNHKGYDWQWMRDCAHLIVDCRNAMAETDGPARVVKL